MQVTLSGMVMATRSVHLENASLPMQVTLSGMIVCLQPTIKVLMAVKMIALQSFRESYLWFPGTTLMDVRLGLKACFPMYVTLRGMMMDVRLEQP